MWDAFATRDGADVYDWENKRVSDPVLSSAFRQADEELFRQSGTRNPEMLALGWIAYTETREPLETATGRKCYNTHSPDGIMHWSAEEVSQVNSTANWDFVYLPEFGEDDDQFERGGYWSARLFWQTCVEHGLGIRFAW